MRAVAFLTTAGVIGLVVALLTGSTPLAVVVIGVALSGIFLLLRDWRDDRKRAPEHIPADGGGALAHRLSADEFSPDISGDPDGPSSDARAD